MKVLIADDSAFMRNIIRNYIKDFPGIELREAGDGEETLRVFQEFSPDLIFLDIIMPKKNGLEALAEIKAKSPGTRVVMVTSVGQSKVVEEALGLGAECFITKPFKQEDILNVIRKP